MGVPLLGVLGISIDNRKHIFHILPRDPFSIDMLVCQRLSIIESMSFLCFFVGHKVLQRVHL